MLLSLPAGSVSAREAGGSDKRNNLSTPELIEAAVHRGVIGRARADLLTAYALAKPRKLPAAYRSRVPWDGTLPLLHLRERVAKMVPGAKRAAIKSVLEATANPGTCSSDVGGPNTFSSTYFYIEYITIGGGLTIGGYAASLDADWASEVNSFGWAAPPVAPTPAPGNKYHVIVANLGPGLYGYVSSLGTHAGFVGNNPNTAWNDVDAYASCMVLNSNYDPFPGPPQAALDATTAHEFNHSIQFGLGAITGANEPDGSFVEGGATWMEDEAMDGSNDNYNYLWPNFSDDMGSYTPSPYPYWVVFRAITERFGASVAGGGEDVMQAFWESTSQSATSNMLPALNDALVAEGTNLPDAYHAAGIALKFNRACGGGYAYPHCLEEGPAYVAAAGATAVHGTIGSVGGSFNGSIPDNYALDWVALPAGSSPYNITLNNTSTGGQLRASAVCDTGAGFEINAFPAVVGAGASTTLTGFDPAGCLSRIAVITNQAQTADNPSSSTARNYTLSTGGGGGGQTLSISDAAVTEGNSGSVIAPFTVTLSSPSASTVTVNFATANGTAVAPGDYKTKSGTLSFSPGQTSKPVNVKVFGDTAVEPDETFFVNLSNASGATIADGSGTGTILNDDGGGGGSSLSISNVSVTEGDSGTVTAVFTVTLSPSSTGTVTVNYATADGGSRGGATAPSDYLTASGTLTFTPGDTSEPINVTVNGDTAAEGNETFLVNLSGASGATIADGQGVGTILNDD